MAAFGLDPTLALAIGAVLGVLGLAFAFWGRSIWRVVMSLIGAALGSILGFLLGFAFGGYFLGLIVSIIGAIIGSILFGKLVKIALALVMGALAAGIVFLSFGTPTGTGLGDTRVVAAIIALFVVFVISYYFIEELIGIITAIIGGILVAVGVFIVLGPDYVLPAAGGGLLVFLAGAVVQTMKVRRQKRAAAAMGTRPPAYAAPPQQAPPPPPPPSQ